MGSLEDGSVVVVDVDVVLLREDPPCDDELAVVVAAGATGVVVDGRVDTAR